MNSGVILFLDVDGVLNHVETGPSASTGCTDIDPICAANLRRILQETDCCIVLASTWRLYPRFFHYLWRKLGHEAKERWVGNTPEMVDGNRGDEIQAWLDAHPEVTRFAIVDDMAEMPRLEDHVVRTSYHEGLTDEKAREIILRLNT